MLQITMQIDLNSYITYVLLQDNYNYRLLTILYLIIFEKHKY
jgi:hypothetical protein